MFGRIYVYKLKEMLRNKYVVGWNIFFPLVLATVFYFGFGNLISDDPDNFKTINVGYVNTNQEETNFGMLLEEMSKVSDNRTKIVEVHEYSSKEEAAEAMNSEMISGFYVEDGDDISTYVLTNGYKATTLNEIVREYKNMYSVIEKVAQEHPENLQKAIDMVSNQMEIMKEHDFGTNTSPYLQYFFALIAMSSLFSSWISTAMLEGMCANMTETGKRFEVAPTNKLLAIAGCVMAGLTIQSVSNAVLVVYVQYILKINMGAPFINLVLITTLGSALGISAGVLIGSFIKNERLLVAVPLVFTMGCSFCSGLMWHQIRQIIESNCPILNRINPAALLVDCLYTRATYGKTDMYYQDILIMGCMVVGGLFVSSLFLRRRKYASI
ncbi:ABC transporter permease [Butyrivibrio fibrisolvens]|uniref:ABC transporter permease n=1 Tax=Pseudobutyrivibrio ruminis TaxID=46206 RepID=UPI00040364D2|nr:ABC transporter permease [Pseudobutyrivibrio ruminis]MDC7279016.1 ABC transporter permease [Butyrivibrio fibrisolvens]